MAYSKTADYESCQKKFKSFYEEIDFKNKVETKLNIIECFNQCIMVLVLLFFEEGGLGFLCSAYILICNKLILIR